MHSIEAERFSQFAYGSVVGLVALEGWGHGSGGWREAALAIITGGVAIWLAHTYAQLLGRRAADGKPLGLAGSGHLLYVSWPIVSASLLLAAPLGLTGLGLVTLDTSLMLARALGVTVLGVLGLLAPNETWGHRIVLSVVSVASASGVVALELLAHR